GDSGGLQLGLKHDFEVIADSFMNITNSQAMEFYGKNGVKRICLSYELGSDSLSELGSYKNIQTELLVYGKKVSMISANCILFNTGECKEKTGCSQNFQIKDSKDNVLDVICADCKNYIFHSKLTDFRKENLKADYLRYDLTGF
ncbi:MAG: U32 family peptidase, partial [Candidatus Muiribacteriota bacterium]